MQEFHRRLKLIDSPKLKDYLNALEAPCYESALLKLAFPDIAILHARPIELYHFHFLLFHVLYRLQEEYYLENKHLFVHFMRTFLTAYPDQGKCRFYEELTGNFCLSECRNAGLYCEFHNRCMGEFELDRLSMKYFYLDTSNYDNLDETTADAFMNGAWELLRNYKRYEECFSILNMSENWDAAVIKRNFRTLAKQYHPDRGGRSQEKFIEINNAYHMLMRVLPGMRPS